MNLNQLDLDVINLVSDVKFTCVNQIFSLSREQIINLTDLLGGLIGFDEDTNDIDNLGKLADAVISKLLIMLENREDKEK